MASYFANLKTKRAREQDYRNNLEQGQHNKTQKPETRPHLVTGLEETQSPFSVKRDWGLTIVAYALFGVATATNIYYAYKQGDTEEAKYLWTAIGISFEAAAFFLLQRCKEMSERRQKLIAFLALVFCIAYMCVTVPNTYGFLSTSQDDKAVAKEERVSPAVSDAEKKVARAETSAMAECQTGAKGKQRGQECTRLEKDEKDARQELKEARANVKTEARASNHVTQKWLWFIAIMLQSSPILLLIAGNRR